MNKKRSFWVEQWILRRTTLGAPKNLLNELELENNKGNRNPLPMFNEKFNELLSIKLKTKIQ